MSVMVGNFRPSTSGFHFPNAFPEGTAAIPGIPAAIRIPGDGSIAINDASNGLCGGMAFAVRDYLEAGVPTPPDTTPPGQDTPLFRHLVTRLLDSWNVPSGVMQYLHLMSPILPDHESWFERWAHGRAWIMVKQEWPKIKADLDGGHLSTLGVIKVKSWNPADLAHNHQVAAYGYDLEGDRLTLFVYDPNNPDMDDVTMSLSLADPSKTTPVQYSPPDPGFPTVYCFFRVDYSPKPPPT